MDEKLNDIKHEKGGKMPYTYNKLRGRIVEKFGTQDKFAEALNVTKQWVSMKMTGKSPFNQKEIKQWCELLDISDDEIGDYFFT